MGFNSISFSGEESTYFGLQAGFNGLSFAAESATYFGLQTGLNSISFGANISVGRLFLTGALFTSATTITVTSSLGSYQVETSTGYFPVYPYWSDPTTVIQLDIEADAGQYVGEVAVTPTTPGYIDIDLEEVLGMAVKATASVVIPEIANSAIEGEAASIPFLVCDCTETELSFTDEIGTDGIKNDKSSFLFRKYGAADTVTFELWKAGSKVADVTGDTYGTFYDFGSLGDPLTPQSNYKGMLIDWFKVWGVHGYGVYTFVVQQSLLGTASTVTSRNFRLLPYSDFAANGTVKIESYQSGNIISNAFDYTDLIVGGWYSSYRISGIFGFKTPVLESDSYLTSDYVKSQIQDKIKTEYTLRSKLLSPETVDNIVFDAMLANDILVTDYNLNNRTLNKVSVYPTGFEPTHLPQNNNEVYQIVFEAKTQNHIKRNF